jgi:hypothetical protein
LFSDLPLSSQHQQRPERYRQACLSFVLHMHAIGSSPSGVVQLCEQSARQRPFFPLPERPLRHLLVASPARSPRRHVAPQRRSQASHPP